MRKKKIKEEISKKENQIEAISELLERNKDVSPEIKTLIGVSATLLGVLQELLFFYEHNEAITHLVAVDQYRIRSSHCCFCLGTLL